MANKTAMIHTLSNLHYRLLQGRVSLEPLRVLDSRAMEWRDWRVTFHILGASHAVCLKRGRREITELMACAPPLGTPRARIELAADVPGELCATLHGLVCRVRLLPFALAEGDALHADFPETAVMTYAYPVTLGERTPITRLGRRVTDDRLEVETVHTYPEEGRGVRSFSRFQPEERP